jgi:hypothetical protein
MRSTPSTTNSTNVLTRSQGVASVLKLGGKYGDVMANK